MNMESIDDLNVVNLLETYFTIYENSFYPDYSILIQIIEKLNRPRSNRGSLQDFPASVTSNATSNKEDLKNHKNHIQLLKSFLKCLKAKLSAIQKTLLDKVMLRSITLIIYT